MPGPFRETVAGPWAEELPVLRQLAVPALMMYSFIATYKAHEVSPGSGQEDIIGEIPEYENGQRDVSLLLPRH